MNLTTDAWIPIIWNDGQAGTVSLCKAFERGAEIRDLAVRPHERIALMRLLICIAQAALDGPADYDDWKDCRSRIVSSAVDYLRNWRHAFELFGDGQRFLQVANLTRAATKSTGDDDSEGNSTSKLDLALATGNNTTLFDNAGGSERAFTSEKLALMLLTFQCFSPSGTIAGALWNGKPTTGWKSYPKQPANCKHAPCLPGSMLHAFLRGDTLADSVYLNILNKRVVDLAFGQNNCGRPIWESMPESPDDKPRIANAGNTYLGRLVPLSRAVRLESDGRSMLLANAVTYPPYPEVCEPSATVVITRPRDEHQTRVTLGASLDRALWRELYSLTVKRIGPEIGGPLALKNLVDLPADAAFDLWIGALVTDKGKAALVLDTIESVFHVPGCMLGDDGNAQRIYENGVRWAEQTEQRVKQAVSAYRKELGDNLDRPEMRNRRQQIQSSAAAQFWTDIEQAVPRLMEVAYAPESLGLNSEWHKTAWGQSVWRAARAAYEHACPHGTPRQIRAYALGLQTLFAAPAEQAEVETEKEAEA